MLVKAKKVCLKKKRFKKLSQKGKTLKPIEMGKKLSRHRFSKHSRKKGKSIASNVWKMLR
jgi:hypothetical protein